MPFWGMSTAQNRNWWVTYKGKISLNMSIPEIILLNGAPLFLPIGKCATTGINPYTHAITESYDLPTLTTHVTYTDTNDADVIMRRFCGGKVGRATYSAVEGGFLTMSLEDIQFKNLYNNIASGGDYSGPWYSANVADVSPSYPCTEPYLFSYGSLTFGSTEFARVREWRLSVDNSLEPKYYVTDEAISQLPYEHREGRRNYQMSVTCDIEDSKLYKELVRQGVYTSVYTGFKTTMVFTRGSNDSITFTTPGSYTTGVAPGCGGGNMGCLIRSAPHNIVSDSLVSVPLDIICRNLKIDVVDAVSTYSGST